MTTKDRIENSIEALDRRQEHEVPFGGFRHYAAVYREFVATSLAESMSFRTNFFLQLFLQLFVVVASLASVHFLYSSVEKIVVWSELEFLFFTAFMLTVSTMLNMLVTRNFWEVPVLLIKGDLDFILVRPLSSLFGCFFRYQRPAMFVVFVVSALLTYYFALKLQLSLFALMFLPLMWLLGFSLLASFGILLSCSMFWLLEGAGINFIRLQLEELSRWPDMMFKDMLRSLFVGIFPVLLIGSAPTRFLLDQTDASLLLWMLVVQVILWKVIGRLWSRGLLRYESASS